MVQRIENAIPPMILEYLRNTDTDTERRTMEF
jgi:hypothetical protein